MTSREEMSIHEICRLVAVSSIGAHILRTFGQLRELISHVGRLNFFYL